MAIIHGRQAASLALGLLALSLVFLSPARTHAQANSTFGTWTLNVAKSKYSPGPPPMRETRVYELFGAGGVKATFTRVDAKGDTATITYSANYDGTDYKYTGSPDADTISIRMVDDNTTEATLKLVGKVMQTTKAVVSADGKTRTLTTTGITAEGQKVNNVVVFDRQ
jgi:hypothetical protein